MKHMLFLILFCFGLCTGCHSGEPTVVAPPEHAATKSKLTDTPPNAPKGGEVPSPKRFGTWPAATTHAVSVRPPIWMLCRAPTQAQIAERKEELKKSHGPHANYTVVVRVNPEAMDAFKAGGVLPVGSTVIKEKHVEPKKPGPIPLFATDTPRAPVEYAWMTKRAGSDPKRGDWEYGHVGEDGKPFVGELEQCSGCHNGVKDKDYLFRSYLR